MAERLAPSQKHQYTHEGRLIYEWDQTLTEVNMYIPVPPDMKAKEIFCDTTKQHLKFGRKGNPPFLDMDLYMPVKVSDCIWTLEDNILHVTLTKLEQGEPWQAVIKGHELDPLTQQQDQQRLLLERFQQEHPGFDFSSAAFNGMAPNARTFMGGLPSDARQ
eukprot:GHUV01008032.1.p1 GENE.GHUV01008032.1~~GHUV01008032.1.p1  ORF type:complete len:161 (+),score=40.95 GHUV01008032.1:319-801(+)